mmetsp:Transcript_6584/g.7167  ORF Transcript_6584/g.7167 Transcript_6584/m.7167 type:complete len:502 (+) Transcript_6584:87-1592(+)
MTGTNDERLMDNSKQALSILYKRRTAEGLLGLQKILRVLIVLWVPVALGVIMMSSLWADIQAKGNGAFTPTHNWESCMTSADYQTIVLSETITPKSDASKLALFSCFSGTCHNSTCVNGLLDCAFSAKPIVIPDPSLPSGKFLNGFSYLGVQTVIFTAGGLAAMRRALVHPTWLPSTIFLVFWFTYAVFTYYTVGPILPVPAQTNSSLITYLYYEASAYKFDNFNNGDNECGTARAYAWLYLCLNIFLGLLLFLSGVLGIYAERIRYNQMKKHYEPLNHTSIPVILAIIAAFFYWLLSVAKMTGSLNDLNAINNFRLTKQQAADAGYTIWFPQIYFPFAQPFFDLSTILGIVTVMSIIRGYTIQSVSAFRLAFITSIVFTITIYPGIVGGIEFYRYNDFKDYDTCKNYFLDTSTRVAFGYPNDYEASVYCNSFRLALGSCLGFLIVMHLISIACYHMVTQNEHRDSFVEEDIDFDQIARDLHLDQKASNSAKDTENPLQRK